MSAMAELPSSNASRPVSIVTLKPDPDLATGRRPAMAHERIQNRHRERPAYGSGALLSVPAFATSSAAWLKSSTSFSCARTLARQIRRGPRRKNEPGLHSARADRRYVIVRGVSALKTKPERLASGWPAGGVTTRPRSKKLLSGSTPTAKCRPDQGS